MKLVKIFKGIAFIALGFVFFTIKFYTINQTVIVEEGARPITFSEPIMVHAHFDEFFQQSGINLVLALLFIGIGVLELLQIKGMKSNVN